MDVSNIKGGKRLPKGYSLISEKNQHPYITVSDMNKGSVNLKNIKYVPENVIEKISKYTITDKDIFISVAGTLGIIGIIPSELNGANLTENADKITDIKIDQNFLFYLLNTDIVKKLIHRTKTDNAQPKLALKEIRKLEFYHPKNIKEETKIGDFLSKIDKKITLMEQKKTKIINLRQFFIHKIFDDFLKNNADFPLMSFSDFTKQIVGGGTPQTKNSQFWNGDINWFTPSEVGESKYLCESERKITKLGVEKSSAKLIPKNSIILTTRATIGRKSITTQKSTTNQGCHSLILKDNVDINFIYYLLDSIQNELIRKSVGSTFIEINKKEIENIAIKVPPYKIQQKIGDFLSSIDKKIELASKQVELMKIYKKGLLQKMFI